VITWNCATGHLGEILPWNSSDTLLVNTHGSETADGWKYRKVILLVRNPYHALSAEFNERVSEDMLDNLGKK